MTSGPGPGLRRDYDARVTDIAVPDARPYSPGFAGVLAGETDIALVDGEQGRLLYRGYPISEVVQHGTFAQVAELLWTGEWKARTPSRPLPLHRTRRRPRCASCPSGRTPWTRCAPPCPSGAPISASAWPPTASRPAR